MDFHPCVICAHSATKKCAGCKKAYYCSREHQQTGWRKHKELCKIYQMESPPDSSTYCGLCGKQGPLVRTECCNRPVCDPSANYQNASNILDICSRSHREYTLCGLHKKEHHDETCDWRECSECSEHLRRLELVVFYGSNRFNFEGDWVNRPAFEPTNCAQCGELMKLNIEGFIQKADGTVICVKHQQLPESAARRLFQSGAWKVDSVGIS